MLLQILLTAFFWFQTTSEIKVKYFNVTWIMWPSSSGLSSIHCLTFYPQQSGIEFTLTQNRGSLCLCIFAYAVPLDVSIFPSLIDFCQYVFNCNIYWIISLPSTRVRSGVSCPSIFLGPTAPPPVDLSGSKYLDLLFPNWLTLLCARHRCIAEVCCAVAKLPFCNLGKLLGLLKYHPLSSYRVVKLP